MRIGQVAKAAGASVQAVRLYEKEGIIPTATRSESGYREYPPSIVDEVRAVKHGQRLGFTLAEMKEFVDLHQPSAKSSEQLALFLNEKIIQLDERLIQLTAVRNALKTIPVTDYNWNVEGNCPITRLLANITVQTTAETKEEL